MSEVLARSGGRVMGKTLQAVVEIAAKLPGFDHLGKVAIGGGDKTNIHRNRSSPAQPLYLLLLQGTQELGLQFQRQVSDLVQEQRAHMSQFQSSDALRDRPGEGAFLMAKELALQQAERNGRAIQLHKGPVTSRTDCMNRPRDQLLTGPGLTQDQHGRVGRSNRFHLLQHGLQVAAFADDFLEVVLRAQLLLEITLLFFELAAELDNSAKTVVDLDRSQRSGWPPGEASRIRVVRRPCRAGCLRTECR